MPPEARRRRASPGFAVPGEGLVAIPIIPFAHNAPLVHGAGIADLSGLLEPGAPWRSPGPHLGRCDTAIPGCTSPRQFEEYSPCFRNHQRRTGGDGCSTLNLLRFFQLHTLFACIV